MNPGSRRHGVLVVIGVVLLQITTGAQLARDRPPSSPDDVSLACISKVLGARALRDPSLPRLSEVLPCAKTTAEIDAVLAQERWARTPAGAWVILHRQDDGNGQWTAPFAWKRLTIAPRMEHLRSSSGLDLSSAELQAIGRTAIDVSRLTPPSFITGTGDDHPVELVVGIDRARLKKGVDSIVVVLGFPPSARLQYGEWRNGVYVPLWESPIFPRFRGWNYVDLDRDGRMEILLFGPAPPNYRTMAAFDLSGKELTRNGDCSLLYDTSLRNTNPTCPYVGADIESRNSRLACRGPATSMSMRRMVRRMNDSA